MAERSRMAHVEGQIGVPRRVYESPSVILDSCDACLREGWVVQVNLRVNDSRLCKC